MYAATNSMDVNADVIQRDSQTCLSHSHFVFPSQSVDFSPGIDSRRHTIMTGSVFMFVTMESVTQVRANKKNINRFSSVVEPFVLLTVLSLRSMNSQIFVSCLFLFISLNHLP